MNKTKWEIATYFHNPITAWIILFCGIGVTTAAWYVSSSIVEIRAKERFNHRIHELQTAIHDRMISYEQALWGGVGLFNSKQTMITRSEFRRYVDTLNINKQWPGIQGVGFSIPIRPEEKEDHIQGIRSEGFSDYIIKPEGLREEYSSIIYLEPFNWRNKRAFGYDMWSNQMRREAMTQARDFGIAATSGIITLVQETNEDIQKGFLTYLPVYEQGKAIDTIKERRAAFLGWVYSPFRMGDLMKGILGSEGGNIDYEIYDGERLHREALLYDSNQTLHVEEAPLRHTINKTAVLELQGRRWSLYFQSHPDFISSADKKQPIIIAAIGILIDLLLFYVITALTYLNKRANKIAELKTQDLKQAKIDVDLANSTLQQKILDLENNNIQLQKFSDMTVGRELQMVELKEEINQLSIALGKIAPYDLSFIPVDKGDVAPSV